MVDANASSHDPGATEPCVIERRAFVRYCLIRPPPVRFLAQPGFEFREGLLRDISTCGLCLLLDQPLQVAARLVVQLPSRRCGSSLSRAARVLRVEPDGQGRWIVGCQLSAPLSPEEMRAIQK
jgi:hypothetical protein